MQIDEGPKGWLEDIRQRIDAVPLWHQALIIISALVFIRLVGLFISPLNLGGDETQYWVWSQVPDFGYFSKPPLIAWIISITTAVCGDGEACVRLAAPLFHGGTAVMLFLIGRAVFDDWTGFWSAIVYATLPAVSLSSSLISTDVPLLFLWSVSLLATYKWIESGQARWAALAGFGIGFGLLAKYAMIYFLGCLVLFLLISPDHRRRLVSWSFALLVALAFLIVLPNLLWNWLNDFPTIAHTASNASLGGDLFHPLKMLEFFGSQFGVFGPILFGTLVYGIVRLGPQLRRAGDYRLDTIFLLCFSVPIIVFALSVAFLSRANANWAAPAYIAGTVLVVDWLRRANWTGWLKISTAGHTAAALLLVIGLSVPSLVDALGFSNTLKRVRGWDHIGDAVSELAKKHPYTSILSDHRETIGQLYYYANPRWQPVVMWDWGWHPRNHYEVNDRINKVTGRFVLFVSRTDKIDHIERRFQKVTLVETLNVPLGDGRTRDVYLYECTAFGPSHNK